MDSDPTIRYQREGEAFEHWATSEGLTNLLDPRYAWVRKAWKAALTWREGRAQLELNHSFTRGDRVQVKVTAGFHRGAKGVVEFVEPSGRCWVLRDSSSCPVFYYPAELDKLIEPPPAGV